MVELRHFIKNGLKYAFLPFSFQDLFNNDTIKKVTTTEQKADISIVKNESGWDRLKRMYSLDEFGNVTVEAHAILQTGFLGALFGTIYGGYLQSRDAYIEFIRTNQATSFNSHFEAKRTLQDKVTLSFARGAFKWGWRLALFSSTYVCISTMIQVYRSKSGIIEYVTAGSLTGVIYKFNMGPRGWIVGGGLGTALGLVCGGATVGLLKLSGTSIDEVRYWQYHWKDSRNHHFRKGLDEYLSREDFTVIKLHDNEVGEEGKNINNLEKPVEESSKNKNK